MKKRFLPFIFILLLMAGLCAVTALAADGDPAPWAGSGTGSDPYKLPDIAALSELRDRVNAGNGYSGVSFIMTENITLPAYWVPIGTLDSPFSGTFDGGCKQLSVASGGLPLFNYVQGVNIWDLDIYGPKIAGNGLINNLERGVGSGTIENVRLKSGTKTLKSGFMGGLGEGQTVNTIALTTMTDTFYITNCTVEPGVVIGYNKDQSCIGSFGGRINTVMSNCVSSAEVYGVERVGGLIGTKDNAMGTFKVTNCQFHGSVTATGEYCGGIVGVGYTHETAPNTLCMVIENCACDGTVKGTSCVGGITGGEGGLWQAWDNGIGYIRGCSFTGRISGSSSVGGLIGFMGGINCYTVFGNNTWDWNCGAARGLGGARYVDSTIYSNGSNKPLGWQEVPGYGQVYCYDSSEDSMARIKYDLNPSSSYYNIAKEDHNRTDDPLGADAWKLFGDPKPAPFDQMKTTVEAANTKNGAIKLTWTAMNGAVKYKVLMAEKQDGQYQEIASVTGTAYTYSKGTIGKTYYFKVVGVNAEGAESAKSKPVSLPRLPAQVTGLKAKSTKKKQVTLTWKKVNEAKKYFIYMSANGKTGWKKIGTATTNKFTYKKAPAGKKMYFRVQAITANGKKGEFSKAVSVKVKK